MNRAAILLSAFAASAAFLGCATPNTVTYSAINAPPRAFARRDPAGVDVFVAKPPARPYVEVGLFEVYQGMREDGGPSSTEDMIATLRVHGGLRGCDAVQVLGVELTTGYKHVTREVVRGVCVVYTDAQAQQTASQPAFKPLPGEGTSCTPPETQQPPFACPDPLVCTNRVCVSPYR